MKTTKMTQTPKLLDRYIVTDNKHEYYNMEGILQRLGYAGDVTYLHIKLDGMVTPITFVIDQVAKR